LLQHPLLGYLALQAGLEHRARIHLVEGLEVADRERVSRALDVP
jgi:hypothetical protein